eukprot:TRINITY_DN957_c0_g1_i1.p1 TRINITY_DN957_c0_g1~~TRINITY_DN957_c0_g1_i1.p1  ORF type:complete len:624 (+),score=79.86 TRINITY_DN957_c0_g1_i1:157-1872(+)
MTGEAGAGVGVAVLQFLTMWTSTAKPGAKTTPEDVTGPGLEYFGGSTIIIAICLIGYGLLFILPFSRYHLKHGFVPHLHQHVHHGEDGSVTAPLLRDGTPRPSLGGLPVLATSPFAGSLIGSIPNEFAGSLASYMDYGTPKSIEEEAHIIVGGAYHIGPVGTVGTLGDVIMHRGPTPSQYEGSYQSPRASLDLNTEQDYEIRHSQEIRGSQHRSGGLHAFSAGLETPNSRVSRDLRSADFPAVNVPQTEALEQRTDPDKTTEELVNSRDVQRDLSFGHMVSEQAQNAMAVEANLNKQGEGMLKSQLKQQNEGENGQEDNGFEFGQTQQDGGDKKHVEAFNPYEDEQEHDNNNNHTQENGKLEDNHGVMVETEEEDWTIFRRFKAISGYCLTIALVFIVTLAGFPAISSDICSVQNPATEPPCIPRPKGINRIYGDLFVPLGFICYQCGDLSGRISAGFGPWRHNRPNSKWLILYACCRSVLIVLLVFCNIITKPAWIVPNLLDNDVAPLLILLFIGNTTGHCASTTMMHALTPLPHKEREGGGYILAFIMAVGLLGGSSLSLALLAIFRGH